MLKFSCLLLVKIIKSQDVWRVPPINLNIKPLGIETTNLTNIADGWMNWEVKPLDRHSEKVADISFSVDFTEMTTFWEIFLIPGTSRVLICTHRRFGCISYKE